MRGVSVFDACRNGVLGVGDYVLMPADREMVKHLFVLDWFWDEGAGEVRPCLNKDKVLFLQRLLPVLEAVLASDEVLFSVLGEGEGRKFKKTELGARLFDVLHGGVLDFPRIYSNYKFNPFFDLLYSYLEKYRIIESMAWVRCSTGNGAENLSGLFNDFVSGMRTDSRSVDFRERVKNYRRSVSKKYKSLMDYVGSVFVRHEKVQVLRVRLSYASQGAMGVSIKTAGRHRQALLKELSRGRLGPLLGYAWRFGRDGSMGWCNDVLIFMNPCLSKTDIERVELIGKLWGSKITGGVGVYYNFNESKKEGGFGGLGVVQSMDVIGMEGVRKMAVCMTKIDDYFKLSVPGVRSFGKGGL